MDDLIFLGMPTYDGRGDVKACWNLFNACTIRMENRVAFSHNGGSLLALAFNGLLCEALNMPGVGYFGMVHADVVPQSGWLDILWDELHATGADLLSVVVPIKDFRGLTSTAIDDPRDPFNVLRRITTKEVLDLPKTFSAADCGYPKNALLVNTGCWLARIQKLREWVDQCGAFTIRDRIARRPDGRYVSQVAPEDWNLSRDLHRIGAKVLATRKVKVEHMGGQVPWSNQVAWGQPCDEIYRSNFGSKPIGKDVTNGRSETRPAAAAAR